jgi:predicted lactoylglutathione lyase
MDTEVLKDPDGHLFRVMYHEGDDVEQSGVN